MFYNYYLNIKNRLFRHKKLSVNEWRNKDYKEKIKYCLKQHKNTIVILRKKIKNKQKINVCFFVMYDSTFAYKPLYEKMLKDNIFNPFIVIIPDISRGTEHQEKIFKQTYRYFKKKYLKVYKGYNSKTKKTYDYSHKIDIACFPVAYQNMSYPIFELEYFLNKNILPIYISYSFLLSKLSITIFKSHLYDYFWKIFIPTNQHIKDFNKYNLLNNLNNIVVSGYPKMDSLAKEKIIKRKRKTIIIAPHHTITDWKLLHISNFLKYANFFIKLPTLYPEIDFVFRPHPLLFIQLTKNKIWSKNKLKKYLDEIESIPNLTYSKGGEYFKIFSNSDGIIHDCASFLAEYLFTEKPACYLLKDKQAITKWFLPIGQKCLKHCYQAYSQKDIINFIDNVILDKNDTLKNKRLKFVNSELKVNYPNSADKIIEYIKQELKINEKK